MKACSHVERRHRKAPLRGARDAYGIQWVAKVVDPWDFLGFWAIFC